jgi:hypothetical protein
MSMSKLIYKISFANTRHKRAVELFVRQQKQLGQVRRIQSTAVNQTTQPNEGNQKNTDKKSNSLYTALALGLASGILLVNILDAENSKNDLDSSSSEIKFIGLSELNDVPFFESLKLFVSVSLDRMFTFKPLKAKEAESAQNEVSFTEFFYADTF